MTTALNTILDSGWDTDIVAKPSFITKSEGNMRAYQRVIATEEITIEREVMGIGTNRRFYASDAYEMYECTIRSTSKADALLIIQGIEKVCTTYTPTSTENVLTWSPADLTRKYNNNLVEYVMTVTISKAGKDSY